MKAVGFPYLASLDVRVNSFGNGTDLLAGDVGSFYVADDGRLGFRREVYDFSYDYKLPLNEWVNIKLWADNRQTVLIIDDTYFYYPNNNRNAELKQSSTFVLPLERICEGLDGEYRNLKITENDFDLDARIANRNLAKNRPGHRQRAGGERRPLRTGKCRGRQRGHPFVLRQRAGRAVDARRSWRRTDGQPRRNRLL